MRIVGLVSAGLLACSGAYVGVMPSDAGPPSVDAALVDVSADREPPSAVDASNGDAAAPSPSCPVAMRFHTIGPVDHAAASDEVDALGDAGAVALVPVPGRAEAWAVVERGIGADAGHRLTRVRGEFASKGDGGLAVSGGADVPPFEGGTYDGVTFGGRGSAVLGLNGGIVRSVLLDGGYGPPEQVALPLAVLRGPGLPQVTSDGRWFFFEQDYRFFVSDLTGADIVSPPSPREVGLSFGSAHFVTTASLEVAYWVNNRGELVGGRIRDGALVPIVARVGELDAVAAGEKYPTWLSEDGCLLLFVRVPEGGRKTLFYARKG